MADDDYCDNCGGVCDGCCGGSNKKFRTEEEEADHIVKLIISHSHSIANLVLNKLIKQIHLLQKK